MASAMGLAVAVESLTRLVLIEFNCSNLIRLCIKRLGNYLLGRLCAAGMMLGAAHLRRIRHSFSYRPLL